MSGRGSSRCVAGVPESPVWGSEGSVRAAAAVASAVALRMRAAGRGGSEDEVEEVDEAEDEEEVVDAGWAVMLAGLWAAASAVATAGRMEGMSLGWSLGEGGAGLWPSPSGLGWAGVLRCVRLVGETVRVGCIQGPGGVGLGLLGCAWGACAGHWVGWACRGARGSSPRVCAGCRVCGPVRGVRRAGLWRACVGVRAGGRSPCRGAQGCERWSACVGLRVSSVRGGAWAGIMRGGVLCRCMCPLAAARFRGQLYAGPFGGETCRLLLPRQGFRGRACVSGGPLGQWWEGVMAALG